MIFLVGIIATPVLTGGYLCLAKYLMRHHHA